MITLVCRDRSGKELVRQTVADEATAKRLMIARNRPGVIRGAYTPWHADLSFPEWAIETITEVKDEE